MIEKNCYILGIESSCDDTAAAVINNGVILSNVVATQKIHEAYGGVVPELASRAHQQNIVPVVHQALQQANIDKKQLSAIAFTRGPGLMGSLLVGTSFSKSLAFGLDIPLLDVNHMQAHILAHFIKAEGQKAPNFPFLGLTISGGHTQIVRVSSYFDLEVIGQTIDDAAGEAFDKISKLLGLPYPGGPVLDKLAQLGNPKAFEFAKPMVPELNYSFSGLKTSVLYFLQKQEPGFIEANLNDLCASVQYTIVEILLYKLKKAIQQTGIKHVCIAGGVSANSGVRNGIEALGQKLGLKTYLPAFQYCTDNAAMIAITAHYKYINQAFEPLSTSAHARSNW